MGLIVLKKPNTSAAGIITLAETTIKTFNGSYSYWFKHNKLENPVRLSTESAETFLNILRNLNFTYESIFVMFFTDEYEGWGKIEYSLKNPMAVKELLRYETINDQFLYNMFVIDKYIASPSGTYNIYEGSASRLIKLVKRLFLNFHDFKSFMKNPDKFVAKNGNLLSEYDKAIGIRGNTVSLYNEKKFHKYKELYTSNPVTIKEPLDLSRAREILSKDKRKHMIHLSLVKSMKDKLYLRRKAPLGEMEYIVEVNIKHNLIKTSFSQKSGNVKMINFDYALDMYNFYKRKELKDIN